MLDGYPIYVCSWHISPISCCYWYTSKFKSARCNCFASPSKAMNCHHICMQQMSASQIGHGNHCHCRARRTELVCRKSQAVAAAEGLSMRHACAHHWHKCFLFPAMRIMHIHIHASVRRQESVAATMLLQKAATKAIRTSSQFGCSALTFPPCMRRIRV